MSFRSVRALLAAFSAGGVERGALTDPAVVAEATRHGVLPVLAGVAVRAGAVPDLPDVVAAGVGTRRDGLSPVAALLTARGENRRRAIDLEELEQRTRKVLDGYRCVALKGAALRAHAVWPDPDARPTRDVDLWLPDPGAVEQATALLLADGFFEVTERAHAEAWVGDHHGEPLRAAGLAGSVELHRHPSIQWARNAGDVYRIVAGDRGPELEPASMILHVIVHAQLQDFSYRLRRLPLVALLDVAYSLESGLVTAAQVRDAAPTRRVARAVDFHLYCAARLRGHRPRAPIGVRLRWTQAAAALALPRLAALEREIVFAPRVLARPMMERREGRQLAGRDLLACRVRFLRRRGRAALDRVRWAARSEPSLSHVHH